MASDDRRICPIYVLYVLYDPYDLYAQIRPAAPEFEDGTPHAAMGSINQMETIEAHRIREDLKAQAYEGSRKILASISSMISSSSPWQRDAFYGETMRHLAMLQQQLGLWRLKVARVQSGAAQPEDTEPVRPLE